MIFAVNCGGKGAPNSFANFKAAAIAFGQSLASSTDSAGASQTTDTTAPSATLSAAASITPVYDIPPAPTVTVVTQVITLTLADTPEPSVWTTTYGSYPGSADPTPGAAEGSVIKVIVGGDAGLVFDPPRVDAKPRDIIEFELYVATLFHIFKRCTYTCLSLIAVRRITLSPRFAPSITLESRLFLTLCITVFLRQSLRQAH